MSEKPELPNKCKIKNKAYVCTAAKEIECGFATGAFNGETCYWSVGGECTEHRAKQDAANKRLAELETQNLELTTSLRRVIELYKGAAQYTTVWSEDIIATALDALYKSDQANECAKENKQ